MSGHHVHLVLLVFLGRQISLIALFGESGDTYLRRPVGFNPISLRAASSLSDELTGSRNAG